MSESVYLNGDWCAPEEALINVSDRGFLFADAVYEASPAYRGHFLRLDLHLERLRRGLAALQIDADTGALETLHHEILARNGLDQAPWAMVYAQISRGVARRSHAFPEEPVPPTVYLFARRLERPDLDRWQAGYTAITHPDLRWSRADLKTTMLLPNVLAQQAAVAAGADDVILVRDGWALEGSHANLFIVRNGEIITAPLDHQVLPGITRTIALELCNDLGIAVREAPIQVATLCQAEEVFLSGTTTEIRPLVAIDGQPVGDGLPGQTTRRLYHAFQTLTDTR